MSTIFVCSKCPPQKEAEKNEFVRRDLTWQGIETDLLRQIVFCQAQPILHPVHLTTLEAKAAHRSVTIVIIDRDFGQQVSKTARTVLTQ